MRIGIIALWHESSTFLPEPTTLEDFQRDFVGSGDAVRQHFAGGHHEISGFLDALDAAKAEAVPIFVASATPGGVIAANAYRLLLGQMMGELEKAGRLDGVLVAPHGAAVSESESDVDGHWLMEARRRIGPGVPMVCTIDPHANLSPKMVAACEAIIPYRTNPHIDQRDRGVEAVGLLLRTIGGEISPTMAAAFPPVAIHIARQHTSELPCRRLMELAASQVQRGAALASGVVLGFPYADVAEMGSSFVVVTDNDSKSAQRLAEELAKELVARRHEFTATFPGVDEAIELGLKGEAPVALLDMGDNVGGGAPGDGTLIAQALQHRRIAGSLACVWDAEVAKRATQIGVGGEIACEVGGKTVAVAGKPIRIRGRVASLHDGRFWETEVRHGGKSAYDMGATAVIKTDVLTLLVHTNRTPPFSLRQLTSCGLEPEKFRMIVVKGVNAPLAAYASVCRTFIRVETPGVTAADMTRLNFARRRRPLFPFEEIE
jgi:microcystin degradation protein MlrC